MIQKKSLTLFCLFLDLQKLPSAQAGLPVGGRFGSSKFSTLGNIYVSFTFVLLCLHLHLLTVTHECKQKSGPTPLKPVWQNQLHEWARQAQCGFTQPLKDLVPCFLHFSFDILYVYSYNRKIHVSLCNTLNLFLGCQASKHLPTSSGT